MNFGIRSPLFKAIFCVLLSALSFAIMAAFLRLSGDVPIAQKRFFATHSIDKRLYCVENRQLFFGYAENRLLLLSRSITGLLGILCGVYIIDHLVLSDVDMIGKLTSFILIILSAIF